MAKKETTEKRKPSKLNADIYPEDSEYFDKLKTEQSLGSSKEVIHLLCNYHRGEAESTEKEELTCDLQITDGLDLFCAKNSEKPKKTTTKKCLVCLRARKNGEQQAKRQEISELGEKERQYTKERFELRFFNRLGVDVVNYHDIVSRICLAEKCLDKRDAELQELKKPIEGTLKELSDLKSQTAILETDNEVLRQQVNELKKDPLAEKCACQSIQLTKKDEDITRLKALSEQQEATISGYMFGGKH